MVHCFLHEVEIKGVFILKIFCLLFARFKKVSIVCAVARLIKTTKRLVSPSNRPYLACDIGFSREI